MSATIKRLECTQHILHCAESAAASCSAPFHDERAKEDMAVPVALCCLDCGTSCSLCQQD